MANPALEQAIINKIMEKGIALPVLPDVAIRARRVAEAPDSTIGELVDVIAQDPAIAARSKWRTARCIGVPSALMPCNRSLPEWACAR
ncbi:MAG: hypothetical protein B7Y07_11960 [Halothiobacillus sp. 24-54-40]|nr:MAG: hypothetical protein B7Y07_11960 [Halothiobacillus sp. 24-54-40]